jgi:hypothetical protein
MAHRVRSRIVRPADAVLDEAGQQALLDGLAGIQAALTRAG